MSAGSSMKILVTGGKGFIGSAVVRHLIQQTDHHVVNCDAMTYAATDGSTAMVADDPRYTFVELDIRDAATFEFRLHLIPSLCYSIR